MRNLENIYHIGVGAIRQLVHIMINKDLIDRILNHDDKDSLGVGPLGT